MGEQASPTRASVVGLFCGGWYSTVGDKHMVSAISRGCVQLIAQRLMTVWLLLLCAFMGASAMAEADPVSQDGQQENQQDALTLTFATFPIPLMVQDAEHGVFITLTQEIIRRLGISATIRVSPPQRAIRELILGDADVLFPALDVFFDAKQAMPSQDVSRTDEVIYVKRDYVFTRRGNPPLTKLEDLKNKRVGLTRGYPYARAVEYAFDYKLDYSQTDEIGVRKLMLGRLDAFIVEQQSGIKAFENAGALESMQYDAAQPVSEQDVYFATANTLEGVELAQRISDVLKAMKQDGTFAEIMSLSDVPF